MQKQDFCRGVFSSKQHVKAQLPLCYKVYRYLSDEVQNRTYWPTDSSK